MRAVLTLVVQLLVDSDQPNDLRGSLRNINSEAASVNFRSETELFAQIKLWVDIASKDKPAKKMNPAICRREQPFNNTDRVKEVTWPLVTAKTAKQ
ncbi:MAG: hypothetical protein GYA20_04725 [Chloroflexi bacterium]|nr:hypothetical protein [Chloroflexota bacterium]